MSYQYGKVISLIILERFGPVIEKITTYLFHYGPAPLLYIKRATQLPLSKIKESLCVLIKFRLVSFTPNRNENLANYKLEHEQIMLMLRYPYYINLIKQKFDDESEMLIEELLQCGYCTAIELILKVYGRCNKIVTNQEDRSVVVLKLREKFLTLITAQYLIRLPYAESIDQPVPRLTIEDNEQFRLPSIDLKRLIDDTINHDNNDDEKEIVYWTTNFDRFHQDMRDRIIIEAFTRKFDENIGELIRLLLQQMYIRTEPWSKISNPIPIIEIRDLVRKQATHQHLLAFFDQYINILEQDNLNLLRKCSEANGGQFQIYLKEIFITFIWEIIEQIILEKFDTKAARIFQLVKQQQFVEPDQIQQLAMIPDKEAKRLSYQLYGEHFLQVQELKRPLNNNSGPNKTFSLFYIDLNQIVPMILEMCYKTLFNIMTRRNYERCTNKRIIDKKQRVDTILMGMKNQGATIEQLNDIEEMITPPEREILQKIDTTMKKLNTIELEVEQTIFLLNIYLLYHQE